MMQDLGLDSIKHVSSPGGALRVELVSGLLHFRNFGEALYEHAQKHPDRAFTRFDPSTSDRDLTWGAAWLLACRWAALFQSFGLRNEQPILLALPNGEDFVGAFFGATLAGCVPAPSMPRRSMDRDVYQAFLDERVKTVNAGLVVTSPHDDLDELHSGVPIVTRNLLQASALEITPKATEEGPGILQFTSATGGRSKAVQLSHRALMFQASVIAKRLHLDPATELLVSWLPLFHDMGLFGFLLTPALAGTAVFLLRTETFASRPTIWMETISRERGTGTAGPPSAYALAARFASKNRTALDLRSLRIALMGAERIMPETLQTIYARLGSLGLAWSSILPAYGMAEVGVAVTMNPIGRGPSFQAVDSEHLHKHSEAVPVGEDGQGVVGCGFAVQNTELQIIDEAGKPLADRHVGQISLKSASLMTGYRAGEDIDTSRIQEGWLKTGDLGYLDNGELFVVGRMGESLNVGGSKYMPEEFEEAAVSVEGVRSGRVVAVGRYNEEAGTDTVVLLVETALTNPDERQRFGIAIRQALRLRLLPIGDVVFVPPKTIARTPNGKMPRAVYRERLLGGEFFVG